MCIRMICNVCVHVATNKCYSKSRKIYSLSLDGGGLRLRSLCLVGSSGGVTRRFFRFLPEPSAGVLTIPFLAAIATKRSFI